jgi:predicted fused transcriptional regulator/phosphomethylpyrimidine kinase
VVLLVLLLLRFLVKMRSALNMRWGSDSVRLLSNAEVQVQEH